MDKLVEVGCTIWVKATLKSALLLGLFLYQVGLAQAASVQLTQEWDEQGYPGNGFQLVTNAFWDDSGVLGSGTEQILVGRFGILRLESGIGQNFSVADFTDPPSLAMEGNMFALYNDGLFQHLSHVDLGGGARITLRTGDLSGGVSGSINIGSGELIYHFPVSGEHTYLLQSSEFVVPIPVPAAAWLFGSTLALLGWIQRKAN